MWQLVNKTNCINHEKWFVIPCLYTAHRSFQGSKKHILFQNLLLFIADKLPYQLIHNRRLAGIGISHQCHLRNTGIHALLTLGLSIHLYRIQFLTQFTDAMLNFTPVQLQLLLTGTLVTHTTTGAALTAQCLMHTHQSGQQILQTGSFHLQLRLSGLGTDGKNIQYQRSSVQYGHIQQIL